MAPIPRIPTVEFRSLLRPPIRISLSAVRWLSRPQCAPAVGHTARSPQCLAQRRSLHLWKTARAKTVLGMHKVITFSPYEIAEPSASEHKINLVDEKNKRTMVAEDVTLQEVYDNHIKPGHMLYLTKGLQKSVAENVDILKSENIAGENRTYALVPAHSSYIKIQPTHQGDQLGPLKVIPFSLSSPVAYFKLSLDRIYQFIENGCPVEVRIRLKGAHIKKEEKLKPGDPEIWPWMHKHWPHLRPDFLLKAMPEGTLFLVKPVSDGRHVQFVMSRKVGQMPLRNLDKRLWGVKDSVRKSIVTGQQSQLPRVMRKELAASGLKDYSEQSGLPRRVALEKYGGKGYGDRWGWEDMREGTSDSGGDALDSISDARYMASTKKSRKAQNHNPNAPKWDHRGQR